MKIFKVMTLTALLAVSALASADQDLVTLVTKGAKATYKGAKWAANKTKDGAVKTTIAVKDGVVYGYDKTSDAVVTAADKTADGAEYVGSKTADAAVATATATKVAAVAVAKASEKVAVSGVYDVVVVPVVDAAKAVPGNDVWTGAKAYKVSINEHAGKPIAHAFVKARCHAANAFRNQPRVCDSANDLTAELVND